MHVCMSYSIRSDSVSNALGSMSYDDDVAVVAFITLVSFGGA